MVKAYRTTPEANELLLQGSLALSEVEHAGVCVDAGYLRTALARTARQIKEIESELRADPIYRLWHRRFGEKTKLTAPDQLAAVVYGDLGFQPKAMTASGKRGKTDEASFEGFKGEGAEFVKNYFRAQKLRKGRGTYLKGIEREMICVDGKVHKVHPSYNLNIARTFRSSCDNPNFQNVPTRLEMLKEMIRRCYIPSPGNQLVEIDYSQIEVRVAACYNFDPTLIAYIKDPTTDMHRDMAMKLFFLSNKEVNGKSRHLAKNKFVFPEFYGDFYPRCARNLWEAVGFQSIKVGKDNDGLSIHDRLRDNGIHSLGECDPDQDSRSGTFEQHVKEVEKWMWHTQFPVYTQWKKDWYTEYLRTGGIMMHTGFAVNGLLNRNDVINYPVQGAAFHCLLWALIRIVRCLKRYKMRSRVVGEIHDCIVGDCPPEERDDFIDICRTIMVDELMKAWKWIIVPLEVEAEVCPIDGSWYEKHVCVERAGTWEPKDLKKWEGKNGPWKLQVA